MAGYYFIKSGGNLYRLTKKAYQSWIIDSANRLQQNKSPAKIKKYGQNLGEFSSMKSSYDFENSDFIRLSKLFLSNNT